MMELKPEEFGEFSYNSRTYFDVRTNRETFERFVSVLNEQKTPDSTVEHLKKQISKKLDMRKGECIGLALNAGIPEIKEILERGNDPEIERIMGMNAPELDALEKEIKQKLEVKRVEHKKLKLRI